MDRLASRLSEFYYIFTDALLHAHFSRHENSNCDRGIVKAAKSDYEYMHCVYTGVLFYDL
jgi:hypothetical protein